MRDLDNAPTRTTIVLFGAGGSGKNFLRNTGVQPNVIVDNDPTKQGTYFGEVKVQRPDDVDWRTASQVVIASGGVVDIHRQLLAFGVASSAIVIPPKRLWGPLVFHDESARAFALDFVGSLMGTEGLRFPISAVFGLALGLVRQFDVIPWDEDIDLYAFIPDRTRITEVLAGKSKLSIDDAKKVVCDVTVPTGRRFDLSIEFFDPASANLCCSAYGKQWTFGTERFLHPSTQSVQGKKFFVPREPERYLAIVYGPGWKIPRPEFTAMDYGD